MDRGKRASKGNYSLRSYAIRRVLRLVPAYYVALALSLLLWTKTPTVTDTMIYLTFLQAFFPIPPSHAVNPVYWSLTPEVVFYALLPLLILKIRSLYGRLVLFGSLVAVSLTAQVYMHGGAETLLSPDMAYAHFGAHPLAYHLWTFILGLLPTLGYLWIFIRGCYSGCWLST